MESKEVNGLDDRVKDRQYDSPMTNLIKVSPNPLTAEDFGTPFCSVLTRREMEEQLKRYNIATYDGVKPKQVLDERTPETQPFSNMTIPGDVVEILEQCCKGPVWDGNLVSKSARDIAYRHQWIDRAHGWNFLTMEGVMLCHHVQLLKV